MRELAGVTSSLLPTLFAPGPADEVQRFVQLPKRRNDTMLQSLGTDLFRVSCRVARAAGGAQTSAWRSRHDRSDPPSSKGPYEILGVPHDASAQLIKQAYKLKARELHPDAVQGPGSMGDMRDTQAFIQLSAAYEILSDKDKKKIYDDTWSRQQPQPPQAADMPSRPGPPGDQGQGRDGAWASGPWRQGSKRGTTQQGEGGRGEPGRPQDGGRPTGARASPSPGGSEALHMQAAGPVPESELVAWRYGVGDWMLAQRGPGSTVKHEKEDGTSLLERYLRRQRQDLETELQQALTHAYLGPRLDHLGPNQLPKYFEAEGRSHPDCSDDILQLVSGRTLLGAVTFLKGPQLLQASRPGAELGGNINGLNGLTAAAARIQQQLLTPINSSSSSSSSGNGSSSSDTWRQSPATSDADLDLIFKRSFGGISRSKSRSIFDPLLFLDPPNTQDRSSQAARSVHQALAAHGSASASSSSPGGASAAAAGGSQGGAASALGGSRLRSKWRQQVPVHSDDPCSSSRAPGQDRPDSQDTDSSDRMRTASSPDSTGSRRSTSGREPGSWSPRQEDQDLNHTAPDKAASLIGSPSPTGHTVPERPLTPHLGPQPAGTSPRPAHSERASGADQDQELPAGAEAGLQVETRGHASPSQWQFSAETEGAQVLALQLYGQHSGYIAVREPTCPGPRGLPDRPGPGPGPGSRFASWLRARAGQAVGEGGVRRSRRRIKVLLHGQVVAGVWDDAVLDPEGQQWGYLVRGGSVGLHTLHCFDTSVRTMRLLCRMTRSQQTPPETWLFPPRRGSHTGSNWYLEWGGYTRQGQRGWLHPSIYCFLASYATLDFEAQLLYAADTAAVLSAGGAGDVKEGRAVVGNEMPRVVDLSGDGAAGHGSGVRPQHPAQAPAPAQSDPDLDFKRAWARTKILLGLW